jgi:phosphoglycerate dehydrogenase-like enzyme
MAAPRVALGPRRTHDWMVAAVEDGGGRIVDLDEAEALVWLDPYAVEPLAVALDNRPHIRWVQLLWAGVEEFAAAGLFHDGRTWTCGKGVYADPVAEHALALGLYGLRDLHQRTVARSWGRHSGRSLFGAKVTVLGAGGIAQSLLRLLEPFDVEAAVVRRQPEPLAGGTRAFSPDRLHEALRGAALVVLALALTPETEGIVAAPELEAMEPHAWLVNVARGRHVVTDDLVDALRGGVIAGAALDVTEPEPLPEGHPLWELPNCLVTPHTANTLEMAKPLVSRRVRENIRRFAAGEELVGLVDPVLGY